jgi:hypothetical protein
MKDMGSQLSLWVASRLKQRIDVVEVSRPDFITEFPVVAVILGEPENLSGREVR